MYVHTTYLYVYLFVFKGCMSYFKFYFFFFPCLSAADLTFLFYCVFLLFLLSYVFLLLIKRVYERAVRGRDLFKKHINQETRIASWHKAAFSRVAVYDREPHSWLTIRGSRMIKIARILVTRGERL